MVNHKEAKQCSNIIFLSLILVEEMILQICHWFNGHKFFQYLLMISPENVSLDKTKLKNLTNFNCRL